MEETEELERKRNGFVTFWLWLCIVANSLVFVGYAIVMFSSKGLFSATPEPVGVRIAWVASTAMFIAGLVMLLKWKKKGFYVIVAAQVLCLIANIIVNETPSSSISTVTPVVILYAILQIRKDGVSCWDWLE